MLLLFVASFLFGVPLPTSYSPYSAWWGMKDRKCGTVESNQVGIARMQTVEMCFPLSKDPALLSDFPNVSILFPPNQHLWIMFPRRAQQTAGHRLSSRDCRKYVLTGLGPYRALYRALYKALFRALCGCPIFPLWAALLRADSRTTSQHSQCSPNRSPICCNVWLKVPQRENRAQNRA